MNVSKEVDQVKVTFNEYLEPSYELTKEETEELEQTGYCYDDEEEIGVIKVGYEYVVVKPFEDYDGLKFYRGGQ